MPHLESHTFRVQPFRVYPVDEVAKDSPLAVLYVESHVAVARLPSQQGQALFVLLKRSFQDYCPLNRTSVYVHNYRRFIAAMLAYRFAKSKPNLVREDRYLY